MPPPENSATKSRADSALSQEVVGCIEAINSGVKSASVELSLDFLTVSVLSGAERTLDASAQLERAARCCRAPDSDTRTWCGSVTAMVLVSSASRPRVSGCTRAPRYFRPSPVGPRAVCVENRGATVIGVKNKGGDGNF